MYENYRMLIFFIVSISLYALLNLAVKRAVDNPDYSLVRDDRINFHRNHNFWR